MHRKVERVSEQRAFCGKDFIQLFRQDASALGFNAHAASAHLGDGECRAAALRRIPRATLAGDSRQGAGLAGRLLPLHKAIFMEPGVSGAKYALSKLGKVENVLRLPLVTVGTVDRRKDRRGDEHAA